MRVLGLVVQVAQELVALVKGKVAPCLALDLLLIKAEAELALARAHRLPLVVELP
ncbi:MAG: hypothetical protein LBR11_12140 [Deltaproteobacteria bacterium]|nr:hypothetical protein [Deltaproteobacteria bacterium]